MNVSNSHAWMFSITDRTNIKGRWKGSQVSAVRIFALMHESVYSPEIYVPEILDLRELSREFFMKYPIRVTQTKVVDTLALILHHLRVRRKKRVESGKAGRSSGTPFHVEQRRQLLGISQKKYFEFLVEKGIIQASKYTVGVSATKYKIVLPNNGRKWVKHTVTDPVLLKNLVKLQQLSSEQRSELRDQVAGLEQALKSAVLDFDPSVWSRLKKLRDTARSNPDNQAKLAEVDLEFDLVERELREIATGDLQFIRDVTGNRVHTNITRLKKELRRYLIINGEPADELDIVNSQPFFATVLVDPAFWTPKRLPGTVLHISDFGRNLRLSLNDKSEWSTQVLELVEGDALLTTKEKRREVEIQGVRMEVEVERRWGTIILLAVYLQNNPEQTGLNFLTLARSGSMYDILSCDFKGRFFDKDGNDLLADREAAKQRVFMELYNDPKKQRFKKTKPILPQLFPIFHLFLQVIKERGYKNFANVIQRLEAKVFLEDVLEPFIREYPSCAAFTIHDSVLVPRSYVEKLREYIPSAVKELTGFAPVVKVTRSAVAVG